MAKNTNGKPLRAVGYCRTSGEGQRDNTSIPRQRAAIEATCKAEGWTLLRHYVDECRSGSKIAGRDAFGRMLTDAEASQFDFVVPFDATRFARDGLDLMSTAKDWKTRLGIVVVDAKGQLDFRSYRNALRNFVQAGVSEHERLLIMERMIGGKIERAAKDNAPTSGRLPFGRTFDRTSGKWSIDRPQQKLIREIAERYVAGESLEKLADRFPLSYSRLWRILRYGCGDTWSLHYKVDELDLDHTVEHKVPPLLSPSLIRAVHLRMEANRRIRLGKSKNDYLLSGRLFCAGCGRAMTGTTRSSGLRLYRHNPRSDDCPFSPRPAVRADLIEESVIGDLFNTFGNVAAIERVLKAAVPDADKAQKRRTQIVKELAAIESGREKCVTLVTERLLKQVHIERRLRDYNEKEAKLRAELAELADLPDADELSRVAMQVNQYGDSIVIEDDEGNTYAGGNDVMSYILMTAAERRKLIEDVLSVHGKDRPGVYLSPANSNDIGYHDARKFSYVIRGALIGGKQGATKYRPSGRRPAVPR